MLNYFLNTLALSNKEWKSYTTDYTYKGHVETNDDSFVDNLRSLIQEGIKEEVVEIDNIINNKDEATFQNTIIPLTHSGEKLERATNVLYNLLSAETSDDLDELANELSPELTEHENSIMLNEQLFERVKYVYEQEKEHLQGEDLMLLNKLYEGFERSGATLNNAEKNKFRELTRQLAEQTLVFSQNLLKETNAFQLHLTDERDLDGLPQMQRDAAKHEAEINQLEGWLFTLHAPSYGPFMMYATNRSLREKMYKAYNSRCTHENEQNNYDTVANIVNLRREIAQLLGYKNYAQYALRRRMAKNAENVYNLLEKLIERYLPAAQKEVKEVEKLAKSIEGEEFVLQPWDFSFYSQKLKKQLYDYDPDMLRPYFELSKVQEGVFGLAHRLYGIHFKQNDKFPVYQKDVIAYDVYDKDNTLLAHLLVDFFPRKSKKGGAWMTNYRDESAIDETDENVSTANSWRPVVSVTTNFTKPTHDTPSLLTLGEVETFLHEFGHALHGIFAMTRYASLSGTSVFWDFVELPSQIMENYAAEPEFLATFAYHYQTGTPLPKEYIDRIRKSRNFLAAYYCIRQVSFGLLDMAYYTLSAPLKDSIKGFEDEAWKKLQLLPIEPTSCMSVQFSHIMSGGYAAGYYSYKWAEVLDADAFSLLKEKGLFNTEVAEKFRSYILSKGGTEDPMDLYIRFRGKKPSIDALLKRDGLTHQNS